MLTAAFVCAVAAFVVLLLLLIPMLMGIAPWGSLGLGAPEDEQWWWITTNQVLTGLFSYLNAITLPWRLSCAVHLSCSSRVPRGVPAVGLGFYGRPTEEMFFHILRAGARLIIVLLPASNVLHFLSQARPRELPSIGILAA